MHSLHYLQPAFSLAEFFLTARPFWKNWWSESCNIHLLPGPPLYSVTVHSRHRPWHSRAVELSLLSQSSLCALRDHHRPSDSPQVRSWGRARWVKSYFFSHIFNKKMSLEHDIFVAENSFAIQRTFYKRGNRPRQAYLYSFFGGRWQFSFTQPWTTLDHVLPHQHILFYPEMGQGRKL